jgi:hypothetical protein
MRGLCSQTSIDDEDDVADLKVVKILTSRHHGAMMPVLLPDLDPAKIVKVDRSDPEFLWHSVVQRWNRPRSDAALREDTRERGRGGEGWCMRGEERKAHPKELPQSMNVQLSSMGGFI